MQEDEYKIEAKSTSVSDSGSAASGDIDYLPPKEIPVRARLNTHNLIFPNLLDNGIQRGTDRADGSMYANIIKGAQAGASTIY